MDQPLVSVIIPCYNQSHFLAEAVESCVAQNWPAVEIIVVDDGSTDSFAAVAGTLQTQGRPLIIHRQANAGLPSARNAGIALARGKYLQFLDADDYLHPNKFSLQVEFLESNPDYAFVYSEFVAVDTARNEIPRHWKVHGSRPRLSGNLMEPLLINGYFPPVCALVRKEVVDLCGGFTPHLRAHEDYEFWMRLAARGFHAFYLDNRLAYYRSYPTSMSKNKKLMDETKIAALEKTALEHPQALAQGIADVQYYIQELIDNHLVMQRQWVCHSAAEKIAMGKLTQENQRLRALLAEATAVAA